jgi:hypothetical protein
VEEEKQQNNEIEKILKEDKIVNEEEKKIPDNKVEQVDEK